MSTIGDPRLPARVAQRKAEMREADTPEARVRDGRHLMNRSLSVTRRDDTGYTNSQRTGDETI